MSEQKRAVILVSGGLDSTTVLAMAQSQGYACYTLSFDYGQRHRAELYAAGRVSRALGDVEHKVVKLNLDSIGGSALTDMSIAVPEEETAGIPITYVFLLLLLLLLLLLPHRSALFSTTASYVRDANPTDQL